jgi:hypothetical protein
VQRSDLQSKQLRHLDGSVFDCVASSHMHLDSSSGAQHAFGLWLLVAICCDASAVWLAVLQIHFAALCGKPALLLAAQH